MEENERRVAHVIGSEAREALRGQRNHMIQEHRVLLGERQNKFCKQPDVLGIGVTHCQLSRRLTWTRQEHMSKGFQYMEHNESKLRVQLQIGELMRTSMIENFQETSESKRQAVISAEDLADVLQSHMLQAKTACGSWKKELNNVQKRWHNKVQIKEQN